MDVTPPDAARPAPAGAGVTIGAYDGVHLGHRALLADLAARSRARGLETVVVTFDRHPATVVRPASAPAQLTDLEQKLELLAACGIDRTIVVPFDQSRANESAEEFVAEVLVGAAGARLVVVGEDFHFGHGRKGDVALLRDQGAVEGFEVAPVSLAAAGGDVVSSTRIRQLIAAGAVDEARTLLGRPHQVRGTVVHGDGRGGPELGYPTANVMVPPAIAVPADGIYAGYYEDASGRRFVAAISVGRRPTFYQDAAESLVEAYLLDFAGDLYGQHARIDFVEHLREERRFDSVAALIEQMGRDVGVTRDRLAPR